MRWYFYILRCADSSFYSGITNNLEERLKEHSTGVGAKYTKTRLPVKLIYSEEFPDKSSACKREIEVKGWRKEKKEALVRGFPSPCGLRINLRLRSG
ncbi:MAG: GIY-YIG nuclease family protein [Candidatus Zixiibacteriota bacterium]